MTISSTTRTAGAYPGTGLQTAFPFAFKVFQASDLYVVKQTASTGLEVVLTLTTDYTVTLNPDQNSNPGGTVNLVAALPVGYNLTLSSSIPYLQPTDLTNQGGFYPSVITDALDRLTIFVQQLAGSIGRALRFPISDGISGNATLPTATARALKYLAFDSSGNPIAADGSSGTPASAFMAGVNASVDAPTARTNLGVPSVSQATGKAIAMSIVFGGS